MDWAAVFDGVCSENYDKENEQCFSFLLNLPHRKPEPTLFYRESSVGRRRQLASLNLVVRFLSRIDVHRTQDAGTSCFFEVRVGPKVQVENEKIEANTCGIGLVIAIPYDTRVFQTGHPKGMKFLRSFVIKNRSIQIAFRKLTTSEAFSDL